MRSSMAKATSISKAWSPVHIRCMRTRRHRLSLEPQVLVADLAARASEVMRLHLSAEGRLPAATAEHPVRPTQVTDRLQYLPWRHGFPWISETRTWITSTSRSWLG